MIDELREIDVEAPSLDKVAKLLALLGNWRIVLIEGDGDTNFHPQVFHGSVWVYPDCSWICQHCQACLGCLRKVVMVRGANRYPVLQIHEIDCEESPTGFHVPVRQADATRQADRAHIPEARA